MGLGGCFVVCVYMAAFGLSQVRTLHHAKHQVNITIAGTVASATTKQIELPATSGRSTNQMVLVTPMVMRQMPRGRKMQTCLHRQLVVGTMLRQKMRVAHGVLQRVCLHLPYMQKIVYIISPTNSVYPSASIGCSSCRRRTRRGQSPLPVPAAAARTRTPPPASTPAPACGVAMGLRGALPRSTPWQALSR